MLRGKIAKRPKEARKGLSPNLGKKLHQIYQQKKATQERKKNLHYPSLQTLHETKSTTHQAHHYPTLAHTPHTLTQKQDKTKQKQNIKTSQAPKIKKRYIFTLLGRKYVVLQLLSKCFDIKRQFNFFR